MSQVLQKPYECFGCKQQIRISKIDNVPPGQKKKWIQYELDGVTEHKCQGKQQQPPQQPPRQPTTTTTDLSKEVATIKAHLQGLVSRLERIEQELR